MSMYRLLATAILLALLGSTTGAEPATQPSKATWGKSITSAIKSARADKKNVIIWFSGSQWNKTSDAIEPKLVDPAFIEEKVKSFVLVRIDFSIDDQDGSKLGPESTVWADKLGVTQLPTLVLLDEMGLPCASVRGEACLAIHSRDLIADMMTNKTARNDAFTAAGKLSGYERAIQLELAMKQVGEFAGGWYQTTIDEIIKLDKSAEGALRQKYGPVLAEAKIDQVIQDEVYPLLDVTAFDKAIIRIDQLCKEVTPSKEQLQLLLAFKAQIIYSQGNTPKACQLLDEALALNTSSNVAERIRHAKAQIADNTSTLAK